MAAINVSYTPKMKMYFDPIETMNDKLNDKLVIMDNLDIILDASCDKLYNAKQELENAVKAKQELENALRLADEKIMMAEYELANAMLNFNVNVEKMNVVQDEYNNIAIKLEDYMNKDFEVSQEDESDDDQISSDEADLEEEYDLVTVVPKMRLTRKDVLTPDEAVKANKASKMHKLKPRSVKRDLTKTKEKKTTSKRVKMSHTDNQCVM